MMLIVMIVMMISKMAQAHCGGIDQKTGGITMTQR